MKHVKQFESYGEDITIDEFIDDNRGELREIVLGLIGNQDYPVDDEEIENWILNDEGLYNWAQRSGVIDI